MYFIILCLFYYLTILCNQIIYTVNIVLLFYMTYSHIKIMNNSIVNNIINTI